MDTAHRLPGVRAAALDQALYPLRPVGRDDLDGPPLLPGELVEEEVEHVPAVPLMRPYQAPAVVVDHHRDVLVALLVAGLVDADPPDAVHSTRASSATVEVVQCTASHATQPSKSRVNRDRGRAHGTASTCTP